MTVLRGRRVGGHPLRVTLSGGGGGGGSPGTLPSFTLKDWSGSGSAGFARQGHAFKKGDVPSGYVPVIQRGGSAIAHQWNQVATYSDGSWKFAVFSLRDTAFSASETRTYTLTAQAGSAPAGIGTSLSTVLGAHDLKAVFTNVTQSSDGSTFTSRASSLTASLATHAATTTRVTKMADGPVAPCWKLWGMAGGDAHLKTESYVIPWLNSDGSVYAIELAVLAEQSWWSIASKYMLGYDAALMDGGNTVLSFPGVQHAYGSHWPMVRMTQDNNLARAPWIGGAMPTLTYGFDKSYWVKCAVVPPFDATLSPAVNNDGVTLPTLTPCRAPALANNSSMQPGIEGVDNTGAVGTRGIVTGMSATAFMRQTAYDYAFDRAFALTTLNAPFHYRSNRSRTRPGESMADTANSVCSLILLPKASSAYDFTAAGLPAPVHAYADSRTSPDFADGYVQPLGGTGTWTRSYSDSSHLYGYSYLNYLIEGSPWVFESGILDWTMYSLQQQVGHNYAQRPLLLDDYRAHGNALFASMPSVTYTGISCYCDQANVRSAGWAINLMGQAAGVVPDKHEAAGATKLLNGHNGDWVAQSLTYMPASQRAAGLWCDFTPTGNFLMGPDTTVSSPWMIAFVTLGSLFNARATETTGFQALGLMTANHSVGLIAQGPYMTSAYRAQIGTKTGPIDFSSNDFVPPNMIGLADVGAVVTAGSSTVTIAPQFNEGYTGGCQLPLMVGDVVRFWKAMDVGDDVSNTSAGSYHAIPPEVTEGADLFIVAMPQNYAGGSIFDQAKLSTTQGGSPIVFSANSAPQGASLLLRPSSARASVATNPPEIPSGDCYVFVHTAAVALASAAGHPTAPAAVATMGAFLAPSDRSTHMPLALTAS